MAKKQNIAFAFGGLGGGNAHGAGFLQAARELDVHPQIITCTSGMIDWVARYLNGEDLTEAMKEVIKSGGRDSPFTPLSSLTMAMSGLPEVFRPAWMEYWQRWLTPPKGDEDLMDRMIPAQMWVPIRKPERYQEVADILNAANVPVLFNSFLPKLGKEYLHANPAALKLLKVKIGDQHNVSEYRPVDAGAVEAALWLYLYGFDKKIDGEHRIDGAYHRQFIIRELTCADRIFVARPINYKWIDDLPSNLLEARDFEIEMWFNAAYAGEIGKMDFINRLLKKKQLDPATYHHIEITPVSLDRQMGFQDYFIEKMEIFDAAVVKTKEALTGL